MNVLANGGIPRHVCGGLGDMLLSLESAIEDRVIDVYSHFPEAPSFYEPFGVTINRFVYFTSLRELWSMHIQSQPLPRKTYPKFRVPSAPIRRPDQDRVVGIHIEGSKFSNDACREGDKPGKDMTRAFLKRVIAALSSREVFPYIFCSPARRSEISALFNENYSGAFEVIAFDDIWASLTCVNHCHAILGTDSAIKTMASILRIPSVVLAADYADPFRDQVFLQPYVRAGTMQVIKFRDIDTLDVEKIIESCASWHNQCRALKKMFG